MPGTPGHRLIGDDSNASDAVSQRAADTPYGHAVNLPIVTGIVGAPTYLHAQPTERGDRHG
jgi:hypothetical protein